MRGFVLALACLSFVLAVPAKAAPAAPERALERITSPEFGALRSIAGWLRREGRDGYVGADVADAMGIPRSETEDLLEARQRGFRSDNELRIAQISADDKRDFLLFMVQRPDDQVYFYFSTVREGLKKAFVSIPSKSLVLPLDRLEAEARFRQEVRYWGERMDGQ
jgi:hypothetical protein